MGRLFLLVLIAMGMSGVVALAQGGAARQELSVEDQPGYEPSPDEEDLPPVYQRQLVFFRTTEPPGTIIVHTSERFMYLVQGNSRAMRYGIGVGRDGFQWSGLLKISRKSEWPDWRPPQ